MFGQASHTPIKKPFQKLEGLVSDVEVSSGFPACRLGRQGTAEDLQSVGRAQPSHLSCGHETFTE